MLAERGAQLGGDRADRVRALLRHLQESSDLAGAAALAAEAGQWPEVPPSAAPVDIEAVP